MVLPFGVVPCFKLLSFYDNALLLELAAPEHPNGRPIIEPWDLV